MALRGSQYQAIVIAFSGEITVSFEDDDEGTQSRARAADELIGDNRSASERAEAMVGGWSLVDDESHMQAFMTRDVLHGSLMRDYRLPLFRRMAKRPPRWINRMASDTRNRSAFVRHLLVHYFHVRHLIQICKYLDEYDSDKAASVAKCLKCWPSGIRVYPPDDLCPRICRRPRICPWCFARYSLDLFYSILKGPLHDAHEGQKAIILSRWRVEGPYMDQADLAGEIQQIRDDIIPRVIRPAAEQVRIRGGIIVHQIGPYLNTYDPERKFSGFRHDLAVLGELPVEEIKSGRVFDLTRVDDRQRPRDLLRNGIRIPGIYGFKSPIFGFRSMFPRWTLAFGDPRLALRCLLLGSSQSYRSKTQKLRLWMNAENENFDCEDWGINGALSFPPTFLFSARQWCEYEEATFRLPTYQTFGSWEGKLKTKSPGATLGFGNRFSVKGPARAFRFINAERKLAASNRKSLLLSICHQIRVDDGVDFSQMGWRLLRAHLRHAGHETSARDAQWLSKELKEYLYQKNVDHELQLLSEGSEADLLH